MAHVIEARQAARRPAARGRRYRARSGKAWVHECKQIEAMMWPWARAAPEIFGGDGLVRAFCEQNVNQISARRVQHARSRRGAGMVKTCAAGTILNHLARAAPENF